MRLGCYFGGTTLHASKLSTVPSYSSRFVLASITPRPFSSRTPLRFSPLSRALSSAPALQSIAPSSNSDEKRTFSILYLAKTSYCVCFPSPLPLSTPQRITEKRLDPLDDWASMFSSVKPQPQWKASIDFNWIKDNKDAVATSIRNRNSNANLDLVLELYSKMLDLQKASRFQKFEALILSLWYSWKVSLV